MGFASLADRMQKGNSVVLTFERSVFEVVDVEWSFAKAPHLGFWCFFIV